MTPTLKSEARRRRITFPHNATASEIYNLIEIYDEDEAAGDNTADASDAVF